MSDVWCRRLGVCAIQQVRSWNRDGTSLVFFCGEVAAIPVSVRSEVVWGKDFQAVGFRNSETEWMSVVITRLVGKRYGFDRGFSEARQSGVFA